ncbi:hypothetical protein H920_09944 [Fukomys damarensis]|uniref:DUF4549 domain-containing protein n=1 Tax=Fukomys damarensis TaxID=885580 RepID=A0A091DDT7_FUKDA|nr:hypothetical protein H920_09944 [Fukomys damarensis]
MDEVYKITSTERTQLLEKELAMQLSELKSEMEERGVLRGAAHRVYRTPSLYGDLQPVLLVSASGDSNSLTKGRKGVHKVLQQLLLLYMFVLEINNLPETPSLVTIIPKLLLHKSFCSSIQIPKDISYFRRERELALKTALQVAEAKPLVIQADVLQRELESCLRREYTPENLPLLLLQIQNVEDSGIPRAPYFAPDSIIFFLQAKDTENKLTKSQGRLCISHKQKQVAYIIQEYSDAVQRAERLSVARENFLMGKNNPPNLVTQEDLTIYTKWLVCHLTSLGTMHHYLQALQYSPISSVLNLPNNQLPKASQEKEKDGVGDINPDIQDPACTGSVDTSISGPVCTNAAFTLPQHMTEAGELKPQLKRLLSHFQIRYNVQDLRDSVKEMELFSLVSQSFQSIFTEQQQMQTFLDYEAGITKAENLGLSGPARTLKKRANWIAFIKIKPKCDPWQKKMMIKLKERKRVDILLQLQAKFLKISDPKRVMQVLQDHAAKTITLNPHHPSFMTPQGLHQCNYDKIWENIYSNVNLYQDNDLSMERNENDVAQSLSQVSVTDGPVKERKDTGYNYEMALQFLGLDDGTGPRDQNPALMRGAFLSFLCLRHLRIRELQRTCLGILNYFRSVERTLTISTSGLTLVSGKLVPIAEDSSWLNIAKGGLGTLQSPGAQHFVHGTPAEHKVHSIQFLEFSEVENQEDDYSVSAGCIHTRDQRGAYIVYDEALTDLKELGAELLLVASHYIEKEKGHREGSQWKGNQAWGWTHAEVDRFAILYDLWTWEAALLENKHQLLDCYFEAYQHTLDPEERFALAQVMIDIMHQRPKFDLSHPYFIKAYQDECTCLRLHLQLVRSILNHHIESQTEYVQRLWSEDRPDDQNTFGIPLNIICKQPVSISDISPTWRNTHLLEIHPSLGQIGLLPRALEHLLREARLALRPTTPSGLAQLECGVLQQALNLWLTPSKREAWYSAQLQRDLFSAKVMGDPFLVEEIGLLALKSVTDEGQKQGRDSHVLLLETFSKLLELLTLRHRLIEMSLESAHLARYSPSTLVLAISEVDDNQIGKFSFYAKEAILKLLFHSGVENMQVTLACQAAQKNALMVAVQQAFFYQTLQAGCPSGVKVSLGDAEAWALPQSRTPEAFVSIQLEKVGLRDMMLNAFLLQKQTMGDRMKNADAIGKVKRDVITEYCQRFNDHMSHYALRGQIMAYCNSLRALLEDFPVIRDTFFMVGQPQEKKESRDSKEGLKADPRKTHAAALWLMRGRGHAGNTAVAGFRGVTAAFRALKLTLQLIAPLHDIVAYLFGFTKLGNCPSCFEFPLRSNPLRGNWEDIGAELQELQKMLDSLQDPRDPAQVAQALLLRREVLFLQFDGAVRHLVRSKLFWLRSDPVFRKRFHLSVVVSASALFPWRAFLADGGPFPVISSSPDTIEYSMQLCFCGLSDNDHKVAHGELLGLPLLMEDVLSSSHHTIVQGSPEQQATVDKNTQPDGFKGPGPGSQFQSSPGAPEPRCDTVASLALLRHFLNLWKQLEMLKEHWGRLKLPGQDMDAGCRHRQFSQLYTTDILYPSMKALARQMGKEDEFEGLIIVSQTVLPPKGASEIEIKTQQITFRKDHLEACLLSLGCDVMAREHSNFETYSTCYEHVLQHTRQRLRQREQELDVLQKSPVPPEDPAAQVAELSHDMIMELTGLRAQLTDLEEENLNLKMQIRKEVQEEYEALVQALFMTCLHIKDKLDENQFNLIQNVCELIREVRTEGIANMQVLKKKWGSAGPDKGLKENSTKGQVLEGGFSESEPCWQEQLQALEQDISHLTTLLCKVRNLGHWRLAVQQARFRGQLSRAEKESIQSKKECLRIKLMAEQEAGLFRQQLLALRQALARAQADNARLWKQQDKQAQLLQESERRATQEALTRQQLDVMKTSSMERLLGDVRQKEQQLQLLTEEAQRASKLGHLQRRKLEREVRQMRSQLAQEHSMKLGAFQRVEELQSRLSLPEQPSVLMSSRGALTQLPNPSSPASGELKTIQWALSPFLISAHGVESHLLLPPSCENGKDVISSSLECPAVRLSLGGVWSNWTPASTPP